MEWEAFASGRAIFEEFGKNGSEIDDVKTWKDIADRISRGFLMLIPVVQPDVIIIGGSMGTHFPKYSEYLLQILHEKTPSTIKFPEFITASHPEEAVIYGCYYYAIDQRTR